ncbi:unnamed protein product [Mucor fragilis]
MHSSNEYYFSSVIIIKLAVVVTAVIAATIVAFVFILLVRVLVLRIHLSTFSRQLICHFISINASMARYMSDIHLTRPVLLVIQNFLKYVLIHNRESLCVFPAIVLPFTKPFVYSAHHVNRVCSDFHCIIKAIRLFQDGEHRLCFCSLVGLLRAPESFGYIAMIIVAPKYTETSSHPRTAIINTCTVSVYNIVNATIAIGSPTSAHLAL